MEELKAGDKAGYVRGMFLNISHHYDLMNSLMTFGQDRVWRRHVIRQAAPPAGGRLLDAGTGTGSIALQALRRDPSLMVTGSDFTLEMMSVGRRRPGGGMVLWCAADALDLPFPDLSFDTVTSGYLVRNVKDIQRAFNEQFRVIKPGGRMVCLDTSPPGPGVMRPFINFYLKVVIPSLGVIITGNRSAYRYLPESTTAFKTPKELALLISAAGFEKVTYRRFMFGTMAVHTAVRPQRRQ